MNKIDEILKTFAKEAESAICVTIKGKPEELTGYFWSWKEIKENLNLRQDWGVDSDLVPFYGDWHELFCLNSKSGEVIYLNDQREIIERWADITTFKSSLSDVVCNGTKEQNKPELKSMSLSPKLKALAEEYKQRQKKKDS